MPRGKAVNLRTSAKKKPGKELVVSPSRELIMPTSMAYASLLDSVEKKDGLISGISEPLRMSSGCLSVDLLCSRGMQPGFFMPAGLEGSAKTTLLMNSMASAIGANVPVKVMHDAENALSISYASHIFRSMGLKIDMERLIGIKNKNNTWAEPPVYRYYDDVVIETVFGQIHHTLKGLPSKLWSPEAECWNLVFPKRNKIAAAMMAKLHLKPDSKLSSGSEFFWCPTEDTNLQAFFSIDSLAILMPQKIDDEEQSDNAMAIQARFLGKGIMKVRGLLRRKGALLFGINQMREKPGVSYGPSVYTPGGNVLKHATDARVIFGSIVPPREYDRDPETGQLAIEESVEYQGGMDRYAFKNLRSEKMKWGTPFRKAQIRIWTSDGRGDARGIDPVLDVYNVLDAMGLVKPSKNAITFGGHPIIKKIEDFPFSWSEFKAFVLAPTSPFARKALPDGLARINIRNILREFILSGQGNELYNKNLLKAKGNAKDIEAEEEDEEE